MTPDMKRNRALVIGIIALVVVVFGYILLHSSSPKSVTKSNNPTNPKTPGYSKTVIDPASGQKVTTITGESNGFGTNSGTPYYLGMGALINDGLASAQQQDLQLAIQQYLAANKLSAKQVSVAVKTIQTGEINSGTSSQMNTMTFNLVFDSTTTLKANIQYQGITTLELFLFNSANKQIFDSGPVHQ